MQSSVARGYDKLTPGHTEWSLASFLNVRPHKILGILFEHVVDLVEEIVELGLDLLALLGDRRGLLHELCHSSASLRRLTPRALGASVYSFRTEQAYVEWVRQFILFQGASLS